MKKKSYKISEGGIKFKKGLWEFTLVAIALLIITATLVILAPQIKLYAAEGRLSRNFIPYFKSTLTHDTQARIYKISDIDTIVIDPGHGGRDGGATCEGISEKDINLKIALYLREEALKSGYNVVMTREDDSGLLADEKEGWTKGDDLRIRRDIIEAQEKAIALMIHLNSFPRDTSVYGAQVFYPVNLGAEKEDRYIVSKNLAQLVQDSLEETIDDGKIRVPMEKDNILLLNETTKPIILIECGFLSNPVEREKLTEHLYQEKLAKAIWEGLKMSMEK